ncbi:DNA excision repair protein ERCC-6-like 2 isoform X2 [Nematostella vectensis]|uniref:DNA excision repair protein ERCC-6-like 2 isoform X2 n=1 Tax=Nematostella vectensis TaxID=45351 RepID=UPI0020779718|nr:DNA excision repair protein ERCC-6-like 2 isoform X2 [Nematostella vectensis]
MNCEDESASQGLTSIQKKSPKNRCQEPRQPPTITGTGKDLNTSCTRSHQQETPTGVAFSIGEMCMALYNNDGKYYRAFVKQRYGNNFEVEFIGYADEVAYLVPATDLRKIPRKERHAKPCRSVEPISRSECNSDDCLFLPLRGNEQDQQMRSKYNEPDEDELECEFTKLLEVPRSKAKKTVKYSRNYKPLDVGPRQTVSKNKKKGRTRSAQSTTQLSSVIERTHLLEPDECYMGWNISGFDDDDLEKPHFTDPAPCPYEPFVLSGPNEHPVIQVPAPFNCRLRDYQREGVQFLYQHYRSNNGAILGDDMGLGKTVQVIALLSAILGKTGTRADVFGKYIGQGPSGKQSEVSTKKGVFLIVCPGSMLYNWKDELDTWGYFRVKMYHGSSKEMVMDQAAKGKLDVVLTTYDTLRINVTEFDCVNWLAVVMDEVHKLKDPSAKNTKAAKRLKVQRRFGLTGTPLQNRWSELWCVLDWANPGCLGSNLRFDAFYGKAIRKGQRHDANKRELALGRTRSSQFQSKLNNWMLRRTKDLIAQHLPHKDDKVVFCSLTPFQEDVYMALLQSPDVQLVRKKDYPCDCGSGQNRGKCCYSCCPVSGEPLKSLLMRCFQLFLKVANHAALLMPGVKQTDDQRKRAKAICEGVLTRHPHFVQSLAENSFQTLSNPEYCGKMKVLDKLLRMFEKDKCKVLLFSYSTELLNILENYVIGRGLVFSRLDGQTSPAQRMRVVREFNGNRDIFICLVSTKAGGLGLNFTGANVVIIFDPTWNPSNDLQAQDRAYRIGQRRDVQVLRLISSGTIEEMMYLRQIYKQQMANIAISGSTERRYFMGVEGEKDHKGELFGIENLFAYRAEGINLAQDIIRRTDKVEAGLRVAEYQIVAAVKAESEEEDEKCSKADGGAEDGYDLETIASQFLDDDQPINGSDTAQHTLQPSSDDYDIMMTNDSDSQIISKSRPGKKRKPLDLVSSDSSDEPGSPSLDKEPCHHGVYQSTVYHRPRTSKLISSSDDTESSLEESQREVSGDLEMQDDHHANQRIMTKVKPKLHNPQGHGGDLELSRSRFQEVSGSLGRDRQFKGGEEVGSGHSSDGSEDRKGHKGAAGTDRQSRQRKERRRDGGSGDGEEAMSGGDDNSKKSDEKNYDRNADKDDDDGGGADEVEGTNGHDGDDKDNFDDNDDAYEYDDGDFDVDDDNDDVDDNVDASSTHDRTKRTSQQCVDECSIDDQDSSDERKHGNAGKISIPQTSNCVVDRKDKVDRVLELQ